MLKFGEKIRKDEKDRFSFELAGRNEPFNAACFIEKGLPYRQFQFAGKNDEKWIISYQHGQGRVSNNKLLIIDMKHPDEISVIYIWNRSKYIESIFELEIFLRDLQTKPESIKRTCYLLNGIPCGQSGSELSF